jgi:hypothetical protein
LKISEMGCRSIEIDCGGEEPLNERGGGRVMAAMGAEKEFRMVDQVARLAHLNPMLFAATTATKGQIQESVIRHQIMLVDPITNQGKAALIQAVERTDETRVKPEKHLDFGQTRPGGSAAPGADNTAGSPGLLKLSGRDQKAPLAFATKKVRVLRKFDHDRPPESVMAKA